MFWTMAIITKPQEEEAVWILVEVAQMHVLLRLRLSVLLFCDRYSKLSTTLQPVEAHTVQGYVRA